MTDFYLITGFLGSGKTSLLRSVLPLYADRKIRLIVNEFGKVGLDGTLLRERNASLSEITDGSAFCVCRLDQFEAAIRDAAAARPDAIFVEASGLSDPGSIRSILAEYEDSGSIRYRGAICLVDAPRFLKLVQTARACKKQLAVADLVLMNKCDLASEAECAAAEALLKTLSLAECARTTFGRVTREQLERMVPAQHECEATHSPDLTLQKRTLAVSSDVTSAEMRRILELLAPDTYRIKGLLALADGVYLADCVGEQAALTPYSGAPENANRLTLLAGEGMPLRRALQQALSRFDSMISLTDEAPKS